MNDQPEPVIDVGDEQEVKILLKWIEKNLPLRREDTPIQVAMWVMANDHAIAYLDDMTQRHMAQHLLDGITPLDEGDLIEWIEEFREADDPEDLPPRGLQDYLKRFFG